MVRGARLDHADVVVAEVDRRGAQLAGAAAVPQPQAPVLPAAPHKHLCAKTTLPLARRLEAAHARVQHWLVLTVLLSMRRHEKSIDKVRPCRPEAFTRHARRCTFACAYWHSPEYSAMHALTPFTIALTKRGGESHVIGP